MSTMTDDETYQGHKNRETWAFNLHWQNDQGLYGTTLEIAGEAMRQTKYDAEPWSDLALGEHVVEYWNDWLHNYDEHTGEPRMPQALRMFRDEVGSWWRVDAREVGEAVREALDNES